MIRLCFLTCFILLTGCSQESTPATPQRTAIDFFNALYNENDPDKAMTFVSSELRDVMAHYQLVSQIQRHVIGLHMDRAQMAVESVQEGLFEHNKANARLQIVFKGHHAHDVIHDARIVALKKHNDDWIIVDISEHSG